MKFLPILLVTLYVIKWEINQSSYQFKYNPKPKQSLETALMTGDKRYIDLKTKRALKHLSLLHLFTPSGLHFSAILAILFFSKRLRIICILLALILSFKLSTLFALQRVIWFYSFNLLIKNTKMSFIITFLFSLIINQYSESPLSFLFSFIFWYIILFLKVSYLKRILLLFITQMSIALIMQNDFSILSLVINPLLTFLISMIFPLAFILFQLNILSDLRQMFYDMLERIILFFDDPLFLIQPTLIIILLITFVIYKRRYLFLLSLMTLSFNHSAPITLYSSYRSKIYPLSPREELIKRKNKRIEFIDRKCKENNFGYSCKKKPSHLGGPEYLANFHIFN
jgi:predicted membrane metal-binding protein